MTSAANKPYRIPPLYGLVLAGGKSSRMGSDKSTMEWHGKEQRYYMADLLRELCDNVFISCRTEQQREIDSAYSVIPDAYDIGGPLGGILSAFKTHRHAAWLVTACDMPLLNRETLQYLIKHRDANAVATTFQSPFDSLPEPLVTIWEPSCYENLLVFSGEGYKCPRKALIQNVEKVAILVSPDADALINANTPAEAERAKAILLQRGV